jgi:hypothetical protein
MADLRDDLFSAPLPIPTGTLYQRLRLDPDASDEEVAWARVAAVTRLSRERDALDDSLRRLDKEVGGLARARDQLGQLRAAGNQADGPALGDAERLVRELEILAFRKDPQFRAKQRRSAEIDQAILQLTEGGLDEPRKRLQYDCDHPPLALLALEDCADGGLRDPRVRLVLLRTAVAAFLAERGERVFHPSDLTRQDFSADFSLNPALDERTAP